MHSFNLNHLILLTQSEMAALVAARNRRDYLPELKVFLMATRQLGPLRRMTLADDGPAWEPPALTSAGNGTILDGEGRTRGTHETIRLSSRPGEPQMALSHDWLWHRFSDHLIGKGHWAFVDGDTLNVITPAQKTLSVQSEWDEFWDLLASREQLAQSLQIFLDNKTLFKNQAGPWDSQSIPILSADMARFLIDYYRHGPKRKQHFKQGSIPRAIEDLESRLNTECFDRVPLPATGESQPVPGGDFGLAGRGKKARAKCAACGEVVAKSATYKRIAIFFKDADERPQSGRNKEDKNLFCRRCAATVFLCPVKLSRETLCVQFHEGYAAKDAVMARRTAEMTLKKYVAQSLNVHAGNFVSLHLLEFADQRPLIKIWGPYHYSLWKMAVMFPPELFAQGFQVRVFPGEETFSLPRWALWLVSSLAEWDRVFHYNCYGVKDYRPHAGQFLRLLSHGKVFQAFYTLIAGGLIKGYANTWRIIKLQDIWMEFETRLNEEEIMPIPDYPCIAGFAGLLLPLAERVQSARKSPDEKKRAVGKLLEEADRPIQYAYTAARESGSPEFIFSKRPRNRFFHEKAIALLEWAGEDVAQLKAEAEAKVKELADKHEQFQWMTEADEKIFICPDQIARVTSALVNEGENPPYGNEADWRAFAYQVKLALWSMFPQHLGSTNKSDK